MKNFDYFNPVRIKFGAGVLTRIDEALGERRALLVTSPGFMKRGLPERIYRLTAKVVMVVSAPPTPAFPDLQALYKDVKYGDFDVIVGIGGGSVLDTAKVLSLAHKAPAFSLVESLIREGSARVKHYEGLTPVIAVPTTAGTGSEVTPWATVWDREEKRKYSLHLANLWCEQALCDPELTLTMAKALTIQTALDALSHSLEAVWNKNANPVSTEFAVTAAGKIMRNLPRLVQNPDDLELRAEIMQAALFAGLAFSNTQTAIAHALSYYLTMRKGIPHGIACSFTLPGIIEVIKGRYPEVDSSLQRIFGTVSGIKLLSLYKELDISPEFAGYGIGENDLRDLKESLSGTSRVKNSLLDVETYFERIAQTSLEI